MRICCALLLMAVIATSHATEPVGRLFTTPNERAVLNQMRMTKKEITPQKQEETIVNAAPIPVVLPDSVTLQGFVKRSDGKLGTVWINQQAVQETGKHENIEVGKISPNNHRVPITLNANGKRLSLKAGQTFEPDTNKVRESRNSINVHAAGSNPLSGGLIGDQ